MLASVDRTRRDVAKWLDPRNRVVMGQVLTPAAVAMFMAARYLQHRDPSLAQGGRHSPRA